MKTFIVKQSYRALICGIAFLCAALPARAADTPPFLTEEEIAPHSATIERVQDYLAGLSTVIADFTQIAPDGTLTSGKFYLQRPGKMRWQYSPPTPILIVSDGKEVVFYDYELEQVSHIPLDSTLIGFMAQPTISFDKTVGIREVQETPGVIRITLAQLSKPSDGQLMLEFSDKPLAIRNMVITDSTNQVTSVALNNARFGEELDKELFIFRDPRKPRRKT